MDDPSPEDEEFDLQIEWAADEAADEDAEGAGPGAEPGAVSETIDELDAHLVQITGASDASMEEIREYIAAAFDAVRDLAVHVSGFGDRLDNSGGGAAPVDVTVDLSGVHDRLGHVSSEVAAVSQRFDALEEALGNDLDDIVEDLTALSRAVVESSPVVVGESDGAVMDMIVQLAENQVRLETTMTALSEEVGSYRRRVQVHGRPPAVTDEQIEMIVAGVVDALRAEVAPAPVSRGAAPRHAEPEVEAPSAPQAEALPEQPVDEVAPVAQPAPRRTRKVKAKEPVVETPAETPAEAPTKVRRTRKVNAEEPQPGPDASSEPSAFELPELMDDEPPPSRRRRRRS